MKTLLSTRFVDIPEGIDINVKSRIVTVKGPRGELSQSFKHLNLDIQKIGKKLRVDLWFGNRKQVSPPGRDVGEHTPSFQSCHVCFRMDTIIKVLKYYRIVVVTDVL